MFPIFFLFVKTRVAKLLKPKLYKGKIHKERTHLSYVLDYHNGLLEVHNEDLVECQGIIQHEVGRKNPKYGKFHEIVSYENPHETSTVFINQQFSEIIPTVQNSINQSLKIVFAYLNRNMPL